MPIAGKGMLLTSMDVDAAHDLDFNRWYDREHLAERVAIPGFIEARRYVAQGGKPKYLSLYSTKTFDVLSSPAYQAALANQTAWSKANIARFQTMIRAVARISVSRGQGRGSTLGVIRLRPAASLSEKLRAALATQLTPELHDGIISMHILESDPGLSRSLTDPSATEGASDFYILIDATSAAALTPLLGGHFNVAISSAGAKLISSGTYALLFDLAAADL